MSQIQSLNDANLWFEKKGSGEPLLMLHPGGVDSRAWGPIIPLLSEHFELYLPDRRGHGHTPDVDGPLTFEDMVDDTIVFIENVIKAPVKVFGYSDGAVIAIMLAAKRPDLVKEVVCAAGVYHYDGWVNGVIDDTSTPPDFMKQSYGEVSPDGIDHYAVVVRKLQDLHKTSPALTKQDLKNIPNRTMIMVADDDEVTLEHATDWYRGMPNAEISVVPGTSHGMYVEKPELFVNILLDFMTKKPVATLAPIRRA